MNREANYLVALCKAYLNGEPLPPDEALDYDLLYKLANRHNISAIAFCVMNTSPHREAIPAAVLQRFEEDFYEALIRYQVQSEVADALSAALSAQQVRHIFFKGAILRDLYPVPQARVMGDIDVLIAPSDRVLVKKLLTESGFTCRSANGPVYNYEKNNALIEMHTKIISGKVGASDAERCFADAMEYAQFSGYRGNLEESYHFAYLIAHIAHHFWFQGAGIKLLLDLAVMLRVCRIDLDKVFAVLDKAGLSDFARVILTVCSRWFETNTNFGVDTSETEVFLLNYGAFGNINRNNAAVVERKELEEGRSASPLKTRLRLLFPPYEKLKNIDYLRFIENRPYLTPAAWGYRIWYNFKYRRRFVESAVKAIGSDETKGEAERELAYFKEIGLL